MSMRNDSKLSNGFDIEEESNGTADREEPNNRTSGMGKIQAYSNSDATSNNFHSSQLKPAEPKMNSYFEKDGNRYWYFQIGANRFADGGDPAIPPDDRFLTNGIRTAKYTLWTFLPLDFFHQITKGPNMYYIISCILQCIDSISITGGLPTNLPPLLLVIALSMFKDFLEDRRRRLADAEENERKVTRLRRTEGNESQYETIKWCDVETGDILVVKNKEFFAADLVLLRTSETKNICFVETKSLDGETNLKEKLAPKPIFDQFKTD
jgi:hypothetical protein